LSLNNSPNKIRYDTDYKTGQDNIEVLGLDIHNPVFAISAIAILLFVFGTLIFPDTASDGMNLARSWVLESFDWFFVSVANIVFLFCFIVAISPLGRIRLGGADMRPEFSTKSWLSMLFSAGVGIGMVFYGAAEPAAYYTAWSGSPLEAEPLTNEARRLAFSATIFHWGITPWAIYAIVGLALAFFTFNKGLPLTIRSAFYPLLKERTWGWPGHVIDLLAVVATLFGLATSLGLGAKQAASGLNFLFGVDASLNTQIILIVCITGLAILSVVRGLNGGVKLLSNINMLLAIIFLTFVLIVGPTFKIFEGFFINAINYIVDTPKLSNWLERGDKDWFHGWTIFYWAWWVSWSPFVGMFIARVSKGRTIREFMAAVLIVPVFVAIIWFTTFGITALDQIDNNVGTLPQGITDVSLVLFQVLENLPFTQISSLVGVVLLVVFFVTSSDSGSLVIDSITAGGKTHAPKVQRVFWAVLQGLVAIVLLIGGGSAALSSLQAATIAAGLPFAVILLVCCFSLYRGLMAEVIKDK
jgi:BCCT family betaine/carnitine transporter